MKTIPYKNQYIHTGLDFNNQESITISIIHNDGTQRRADGYISLRAAKMAITKANKSLARLDLL